MLASLLPVLWFFLGTTTARRLVAPRSASLPLQLLPRTQSGNVSTVAGITSLSPASDHTMYTVISVGGLFYRVALDTGSSDLVLVSSACRTSSCKAVPAYPLERQSSTFVSVNGNQTLFNASYADETAVSGFVAAETVQVANITLAAQPFALVTDSDLPLVDDVSGILGLGFPRLSSISSLVSNSTPFFPTLAQQGLLDYPLFGLNLASDGSGSLALGGVDSAVVSNVSKISWNAVVEFSPLGSQSNTSSYLHWVIPMKEFAVNTTKLTPIPTYPKDTGNGSLALFDVGTSGIFGPYADVERIFSGIDGSRLVADGLWAIPCTTTVPISFTFGSQNYSMDPTEYLIGPASGNPESCLSWPMALRPSGDGIDWQFGTPFLSTVYSVFSYGINGKESPHIGLYSLKNRTQTLSAANVSAFLSSASATVATTLPNSLLSTPSVSVSSYAFNTSVTAATGGIVSSALATSTYSALFGKKTTDITSLPVVSLVPTLTTLTTTSTNSAGSTTLTIVSTLRPSIALGLPQSNSAYRILPVQSHTLSFVVALAICFAI